jgi:hypothetical protein
MRYTEFREARANATEAAKNLIDALRPMREYYDEQINQAKKYQEKHINLWGEAREQNNLEEKKKHGEEYDYWTKAAEDYLNDLDDVEDAIRFAKRIIPGKQY